MGKKIDRHVRETEVRARCDGEMEEEGSLIGNEEEICGRDSEFILCSNSLV